MLIHTSVYRKPTSTGELLNYKSECPDKYKKGVVKNLLVRARKIASSLLKFELRNWKTLKKYFLIMDLQYSWLIPVMISSLKPPDNCIKKF